MMYQGRKMRLQLGIGLLAGIAELAGCGKTPIPPQATNLIAPPVGTVGDDGSVVKSRATFDIQTGGTQTTWNPLELLIRSAYASTPTTIDQNTTISVTNAASTSMTLNMGLWSIPSPITPFAVNDFGFIQIGTLQDNNLNVCGTGGTSHCGTALIRMYTTGTAGAGLWNSTDAYGAPITAGQASPLGTVGLNVAGAATMQSLTIASNKHTVKLADFTNPKYDVQVDFSGAGTGSYATTLVVEYALSP